MTGRGTAPSGTQPSASRRPSLRRTRRRCPQSSSEPGREPERRASRRRGAGHVPSRRHHSASTWSDRHLRHPPWDIDRGCTWAHRVPRGWHRVAGRDLGPSHLCDCAAAGNYEVEARFWPSMPPVPKATAMLGWAPCRCPRTRQRSSAWSATRAVLLRPDCSRSWQDSKQTTACSHERGRWDGSPPEHLLAA